MNKLNISLKLLAAMLASTAASHAAINALTTMPAPLHNPSLPNSANIPTHAMAADSAGNVYFQQVDHTDRDNDHTIKVYDSSGGFVKTFSLDQFSGTMTLRINDGKLYAGGGNYTGSIDGYQVYDLDGNYLSSSSGILGHVGQMAFGSQGQIAMSHNYGSSYVQAYDLGSSGSLFTASGYVQSQGVAYDSVGNLYTTDPSDKKIFSYDASGNENWNLSLNYNPWNIEVTESYLYVSVANGRDYLYVYDLNGSIVGTADLAFSATHLDYNGTNLYVGGYDGIAIFDEDDILNGITTAPVPEPSTYALLFGIASLAIVARRRLN